MTHAQNDDAKDVQRTLAENVNKRLEKAMNELKEKHNKGTNEVDAPDRAPTGPAYQAIAQQRQLEAQEAERARLAEEEARRSGLEKTRELRREVQEKMKKSADEEEGDSDDDSFLDDEDDDPVLEEIRRRRMEEMRKVQMKHAENVAKGHGRVRTIAQDEFLPECTGSSEWVAIHFFHRDFERCKIMDHHLNIVAPLHSTCKFLRIDAEKAPFFVSKLQVRTLPTLIAFRDGKVVRRLTGFDGLVSSANGNVDPDRWETSRLQEWLASTGAIEYERNPSADELRQEMERLGVRGPIYSALNDRDYNDDDE